MRAAAALEATWKRMGRPFPWAAVLLFGLLWNLARALILAAPLHWEEALLPFALGVQGMVLSPLPWQWSGREGPAPGLLRGLAQALPWNLVLTVAIFALLPFHGPGEAVSGRGQGRGRPPWAEEGRGESGRALSPRMLALAAAGFSFALLLGLLLARLEGAEAKEAQARDALRAAQVRALQAQMNPHVLFNLISAFSEMAREDPARTEQAMVDLAELLRRLLDHSGHSLTPLAAERALVETYLELEGIRLGPRLRVRWEWDPSLDSVLTQPLLLQPLVENAIKHGIAPSREGGEVLIRSKREGARALLQVINSGAPLIARTEGTGLGNLRQRLQLSGDAGAGLSLSSQAGLTVAELRAPVYAHA